MKYTVLSILMMSLLAFSCKDASTTESDTAEAPELNAAENTEGTYYGEEFEIMEPIQVDAAMEKMTRDTMNIQVSGIVESVCKSKGCWTNIASEEGDDETIFVKFKDYGFFLPLDCEGQEVVMTGKAFLEETSVDELRHYAEDEGKSEEEIAAITEPVEEYKFLASGVYLKAKS